MKLWAIIIAILILLVMITIHEFGHYIAGKIFKFKINEFSIGMGPALIKKKKKNGEIFSVRAFPLGGYCAFEGEDEEKDVENSFNSKKPWQRIVVLIAGAFMNFLLALLVIIVMFSCYGETAYSSYEVKTSEYVYALQDGDVILELNGKKIMFATDFVKSLDGKKKGSVVKAKVVRKGKKQSINIEMREDVKCKSVTDVSTVCKALGIATSAKINTKNSVYDLTGSGFMDGDYLLRIKDFEGEYTQEKYSTAQRIYGKEELIEALREKNGKITIYVFNEKRSQSDSVNPTEKDNRYELNLDLSSFWSDTITDEEILSALKIESVEGYYKITTTKYNPNFFALIGDSFVYSGKIGGLIFTTLGQLLTGKLGLKSVGGPITTVVTTSKIVTMGLEYLLEIVALIGVNLAVFNLLPIPALDGSRVVFTLIEWIFKKPVPKKIEGVIHAVGLLLLLGFSVLVDILQFV